MAEDNLLTMVSDIVTAHTSQNRVTSAELPVLIQSVYATLAGLGQVVPVVEEKRKPAVSIRSSVKPDAITCLECGARQKMLKRHLNTYHQLSPADYKARWGLSDDYPLVTSDHAAKRRNLAIKFGLGRKAGTKVKRDATGKPKAVKAPVRPVES